MFKIKKKFNSIFKEQYFNIKKSNLNEHYFNLKNISNENIRLSTCDLREKILIIDERKNEKSDNYHTELLNEIIKQDSPFVFFANSLELFEQAKTIIKNNKKLHSPVYTYQEKVSFVCTQKAAFDIIQYYIYFKEYNKNLEYYIKTKDLFYKYTDFMFEFSINYIDFIIKNLLLDEDKITSSIIIDAINEIRPFLKQYYNGKSSDFENIFTQRDNSFLLFFQNENFNEFFYLITSVFHFYSSSTYLFDEDINCFEILKSINVKKFKRRYFILPILEEKKEDKLGELFFIHRKFICDYSNGLSFFILYTKKESLNHFDYNWIGNIITLKDDKNDFKQIKLNY